MAQDEELLADSGFFGPFANGLYWRNDALDFKMVWNVWGVYYGADCKITIRFLLFGPFAKGLYRENDTLNFKMIRKVMSFIMSKTGQITITFDFFMTIY